MALAEDFSWLQRYLKQRRSIIISMFLKTDGALPGNHNPGVIITCEMSGAKERYRN